MAIAAQQRFCINHPERTSSAICVTCRRAICHECATQWDGINYCVRCLAAQRTTSVSRGSFLAWIPLVFAIVILLFVVSGVLVWVGTFMAENF